MIIFKVEIVNNSIYQSRFRWLSENIRTHRKSLKPLLMLRVLFLAFSILTCFFTRAQSPKLLVTPLTGSFYVFSTYHEYNGQTIPANGMYLVTPKGVVLFDTPWDTTQFQPLLDTIRTRHHQEVIMAFATHFHADRTAGLEWYQLHGIQTYTTRRTDEWSAKRGMKRATNLMDNDTTFRVNGFRFQTYYPGPGHAPDNIVIWFPKEKILYGGCLVKCATDTDLGNLSDANLAAYAQSIRNVLHHCPHAKYIIPGHGDWTNTRSLQHTLELAEAAGSH